MQCMSRPQKCWSHIQMDLVGYPQISISYTILITGFLLTLSSSIWLSVFMMSVILVIKMEMAISRWILIALFYFGFPSACQIECMTFFVCLFRYFIVTVVGFLFGFVFVNLLLKKFGFALWGFYSHVTFFCFSSKFEKHYQQKSQAS